MCFFSDALVDLRLLLVRPFLCSARVFVGVFIFGDHISLLALCPCVSWKDGGQSLFLAAWRGAVAFVSISSFTFLFVFNIILSKPLTKNRNRSII